MENPSPGHSPIHVEIVPVTLIDLLSNALVRRHTSPYIPVADLLQLGATCKPIRQLIYQDTEPWRHLDLTPVRRAIIDSTPIDVGGVSWRAERMDESLTEDDFYAGPLRGILGNLHCRRVLKFVQTLILDGLTVPADLVREIVAEDRYHVRVLSLRESKQLNITKLQQVLRYAVRPTREPGTPRLKALYIFGQKDTPVPHSVAKSTPPVGQNRPSSPGVMSSADNENRWYGRNGKALQRPYSEWAETVQVCQGIIHFDAVLCRGPRHDITKVSSTNFLQPTIATIALGPEGCQDCHTSPEGPAGFGDCDSSDLPLLAPVPLHSSTVRACIRPEPQEGGTFPRLILRCEDCLRGRYCEQCHRWWCEDCYQEPVPSGIISRCKETCISRTWHRRNE